MVIEAGVSNGIIINAVKKLDKIVATGCDVYVDPQFINDSSVKIYEGTIYESLNMLDDGSINVFYWNDVIEHIAEDEIEQLI